MPSINHSDERRFWKSLCNAFQSLLNDITSGKTPATNVDPRTRQFIQSPQFGGYLRRLIFRMTSTIRKQSARSWRDAAARSGNGPEIARLIREEMKGPVGTIVWNLIEENATYIKTLPDEWARYASRYAYRKTLQGARPEEVEAELRQIMPGHITKNLKTIARTECAKANAAIVQARAEMCGIKAYIWRCVNDERSRDSHAAMDGILVFYDDPPNPEALFPSKGQKPYGSYHAGNTFNCRCYQEPVVDISFLPDIIRVHDHGSIVTMTRAQIQKRYGQIAQAR